MQYPVLLLPTSNTHACESLCYTGQSRGQAVHWTVVVFSIKYCHSSRKIVSLQTEFKMKCYIIMPIHQCDYRGGWKINCLFNNIPAHVFSIYAVSLYTLYTGCLKRFLVDMENATVLIFTYVLVLFAAVGNSMLMPNLVSVRCCTVNVRNQFASQKYE